MLVNFQNIVVLYLYANIYIVNAHTQSMSLILSDSNCTALNCKAFPYLGFDNCDNIICPESQRILKDLYALSYDVINIIGYTSNCSRTVSLKPNLRDTAKRYGLVENTFRRRRKGQTVSIQAVISEHKQRLFFAQEEALIH